MHFYYFSILSTILVELLSAVVLVIFWFAWTKGKLRTLTPTAALISAAVVFALPWTEELWIAYHFGQLCGKDGGVFVSKAVEADGFFDETGGSLELVRSGKYRFLEYRDKEAIKRLTSGDADFTRLALTQFERDNPGKVASTQEIVRANIGDGTEALVFPKKGDSWRIATLDHPSARYHYKQTHRHATVSHKIRKTEYTVTDTQANELLARETVYVRDPYWFFVGLDRAPMVCNGVDQRSSPSIGSIVNAVLKPTATR